jgi:hypothetical protein
MNRQKKCIAINLLFLLALSCMASMSYAGQVAATVTRLSGLLMVKKADGTVKILAVKSALEEGDTLTTEKNTYAQIKFVDNSEVTLKPSTTFKIEAFAFDTAKPDADNASFNLVKGGLRSVTGLLGKRNNEKFALKTPTATIGIRGTTFIAEYVEPSEETKAAWTAYNFASTAALGDSAVIAPLQLAQNAPIPPTPGARAPGLYVQVIDGLIHVANPAGATNFSAGQFGYTPNFRQPPVLVPQNPGIQFTPPPAFSSSNAPSGSGSGSGNKGAAVDCEVR